MKFYVSARTAKANEVKEMYKKIRERGNFISFDWTEAKDLRRSFNQNPEIARKYAGKIIRAIKNSDIFVMISDKEDTDIYGELASAISFNIDYKKPEIFVLGDNISQSIFPHHSSVIYRDNIEEVLNLIESNPFVIRRKVIDNVLNEVERIRRK